MIDVLRICYSGNRGEQRITKANAGLNVISLFGSGSKTEHTAYLSYKPVS